MQVLLKKLEYQEKVQYFSLLFRDSDTQILYRFTERSKSFQDFISWNVSDYGLTT